MSCNTELSKTNPYADDMEHFLLLALLENLNKTHILKLPYYVT